MERVIKKIVVNAVNAKCSLTYRVLQTIYQ